MSFTVLAEITTGQKGPSYSVAADDSHFIIRQGTKLMYCDMQTQNVLSQLDLHEYKSTPCIVYEGIYYELTDTEIIKIDL